MLCKVAKGFAPGQSLYEIAFGSVAEPVIVPSGYVDHWSGSVRANLSHPLPRVIPDFPFYRGLLRDR